MYVLLIAGTVGAPADFGSTINNPPCGAGLHEMARLSYSVLGAAPVRLAACEDLRTADGSISHGQ
jgi:hypothetical protein